VPAESEKTDSKLSPSTLVIASVASAAAAIFIHEVWTGGAIVGAAITPVIVAIVSESLKKPTEKLSAVTARPARRGATRAPEPVEAQAVELQREDRFGIWEDEKRRGQQGGSAWHKLNRKHLKIALATGALAFVVAVVALTAAELVFGGSVGSSGERTTIFRGGGGREAEKTTTTETTAPEETVTTPQEAPQTEPIPQDEQAPPATTPTTPPPTTAPAPAPDSGGTPAPATPAPAPGATQPAPVPCSASRSPRSPSRSPRGSC